MPTDEGVHYPKCNIWCNEHGHYLLGVGSPFSHQGDVSPEEVTRAD